MRTTVKNPESPASLTRLMAEAANVTWRCSVCNKTFGSNYDALIEHGEQCHRPPTNPTISRKEMPVFSGVLQYFPDAIKLLANHSKKGNDKHNPGQPLHWAKEKSNDHAECIARHLIDIGPNWDQIDEETGSYHAAALAWRALALLQTLLEREGK